MSKYQEILDFWFGAGSDRGKERKVWFIKDKEFDQEVKTRFLSVYHAAASGKLDSWKDSPDSCLALILLLDQFPRNIFRNSPQAFATDEKALEIAKYAVKQGYDIQLLPVERWFIYLPFEHSEKLEHQHQAVALFETLQDDPQSSSSIDYAKRHLEVIKRFGRFPHRNAILGRENTPEEEEFLQQPGSSF